MKTLLLLSLLLCNLYAYAQTTYPNNFNPNNGNDVDLNDFFNQPTVIDNTKKTHPPSKPSFACSPEPFDQVAGITLYEWSESKSFYFFETKMSINVSGSPRAYHPEDKGLNKLEYAGRQGNWSALVTHNKQPNGNPIIQKTGDPYPGYYVSMTATTYRGFPEDSPARYIDAEKVPYFVLNTAVLQSTNTQKGDIGYVYNRKTKKGCYAILGDVSSNSKLGEGSIYLANQLGVNATPRTGGQNGEIVYIVFPFSGNGVARSLKEINTIGEKLMQKADAFTFIRECLEGKVNNPSSNISENYIRIEKNDEIIEKGKLFLQNDLMNSHNTMVITHPNLPTGTIVLIKNLTNQKTIIAQVIANSKDGKINASKKVFEKLQDADTNAVEVEVTSPKH